MPLSPETYPQTHCSQCGAEFSKTVAQLKFMRQEYKDDVKRGIELFWKEAFEACGIADDSKKCLFRDECEKNYLAMNMRSSCLKEPISMDHTFTVLGGYLNFLEILSKYSRNVPLYLVKTSAIN